MLEVKLPVELGSAAANVGGSAGRRELTERLVYFDAEAREYAHTIVAGPVQGRTGKDGCRSAREDPDVL
jgi:hypothetical protein